MICKNCGSQLADGSLFCEVCGAKQDMQQVQNTQQGQNAPKVCPNCGSAVQEGMMFCEVCGAKLGAQQVQNTQQGQNVPKVCPNCGSAVQEGMMFCEVCGAKLGVQQPYPPQNGPYGYPMQPAAVKKKNTGLIVLIVVIAAVVVLGAAAAVLFLTGVFDKHSHDDDDDDIVAEEEYDDESSDNEYSDEDPEESSDEDVIVTEAATEAPTEAPTEPPTEHITTADNSVKFPSGVSYKQYDSGLDHVYIRLEGNSFRVRIEQQTGAHSTTFYTAQGSFDSQGSWSGDMTRTERIMDNSSINYTNRSGDYHTLRFSRDLITVTWDTSDFDISGSSGGVTGFINTKDDPLNMRESNSTESKIIAKIPKKYEVTIIDDDPALSGWLYVEYNGQFGFVSAQYVRINN